jgi:hypothetical protein
MASAEDLAKITQGEVEDIVTFWQTRLGLLDWDVRTNMKRHFRLDPGVDGLIETFTPKKQAFITLLNPLDRNPDFLDQFDIEYTIVHELLHIHWEAWKAQRVEEHLMNAEEQAVHCIARALVALHRFRPDLAPDALFTPKENLTHEPTVPSVAPADGSPAGAGS